MTGHTCCRGRGQHDAWVTRWKGPAALRVCIGKVRDAPCIHARHARRRWEGRKACTRGRALGWVCSFGSHHTMRACAARWHNEFGAERAKRYVRPLSTLCGAWVNVRECQSRVACATSMRFMIDGDRTVDTCDEFTIAPTIGYRWTARDRTVVRCSHDGHVSVGMRGR